MSTSVAAVVAHFPDAENGFTTTTSGSVASGATTVGLNSVAGYTNGQPAVFVIDPTDAVKKQTFTGIVDTGGSQITAVKWTAGTNQAHLLGATVVDYATATHIAMISKGILVHANQDGSLIGSVVNNSLTGQTLPANTVGTTSLASNAVTTAKITDANVTNAKLATGATRLGINKVSPATTVAASYTTYATVTATSTGRECEADFRVIVSNANSGGARQVFAKIQCDGVDVTPIDLEQYLFNATGDTPKFFMSYIVSSTPTAGSHTWTLQLRASSAAAVNIVSAVLKVSEIA